MNGRNFPLLRRDWGTSDYWFGVGGPTGTTLPPLPEDGNTSSSPKSVYTTHTRIDVDDGRL